MTFLSVGISCIIVGFGLSSLSFYEVKDSIKFLMEEPSKIRKVAFFLTIFEYVSGLFLFGVLLILFGVFATVFSFL